MNSEVHSRINWWINILPRIVGVTAIVAGSIVIVGWFLDIELLKSLHPSLVSMKANTALAFVLAGMVLMLHSSPGTGRQRMTRQFMAFIVLLVGLITVAEYAFQWDAGIDQLLFREPHGTIGTFLPGRMAFSSALSLCFVGLSLLMLKRRNKWSNWSAQVLALLVGVLGMLALVAYVYGLPGSTGFAVYTRMALHTSIAFILLSIGIICLQPDFGLMAVVRGDGPGGFMARRLMFAAIVLPIVLGWVVAQGEMMGLYGSQFGDVIDATIYIALFVFLIWLTGRSLITLDVERKRLELSLLQSEKEFRELFDYAPVGYHELDAEGRISRINQTELTALGYRADEMLGHFSWEFVREREDSRQAVLAKLSGMLPPARGIERIFVRKDGTTMTVMIEDQLLRDALGHITGIRTILQDVTELRQARELLRDSEERHRTVLQNLAEGVGIVDDNERFTFANPAAETIFGVPSGTLIGKSLQEYMDPEEFDRMLEQTNKRRKGEIGSYEIKITNVEGVRRNLLVTVSPYADGDGTFVGAIGILRDITQDKMLHDLLVEKEKSARLTSDISALWVQNEALPAILKKCSEAIVLHMDAAFARIWTLNRQENMLELQASAGLYTHLDGPHGRVPVGKFKIGLIAAERKPHVTNNVIADPRLGDREWAKREGIVSFAGYPLMMNGEVIGVIALFARRPLSEFVVSTLENVVEKIANGIEHKRTEELLRETEAHYRLIVESATDLIYNLDSQGNVTSVNPATSRLLGYSPDEILGRRYVVFVRPDFRKRAERTFIVQLLRKTPSIYFEAPVLTKDGRELWFGQNVDLIVKDGEAVGYQAVSRDITERKQAEKLAEALYSISQAIHSTDSLNALFEVVHRDVSSIMPAKNFFVALLSDDGKRLDFPYGRDEKDPDDWRSISIDEGQSLSVEVFRSGRSLILNEKELQDRYSSGKNRVWGTAPKCWLGVPLLTAEKTIGVMVVQDYVQDNIYSSKDLALFESAAGQIALAIERKRSEESLKKSVSLLQATLESTADGILVVDNSGKMESYNKEFAAMWMIPDDVVESRDDDRALNHVLGQLKDPDAFISKVRELYAHPDEKSFDLLEFKDGRVFERYSLPQRIDGKPIGRVWSFRNVTERKRAENAVIASELEFRRVWESTFDGMRVVDGDGTILMVNEAYCTMIGKGREELVGKPFSIFTVESQQRQTLERHKERFASGTIQPRAEKELLLWNGKRVWFEVSSSSLEIEGRPKAVLSIFRDITDRKRAEAALAREQYLLNSLLENVPDHIYFKDAESRFARISKAQAQRFGLSDPAQAVGKTDFDFFTEEHARLAYDDEQEIIRTGGVVSKEERETWPDRPDTWVTTTKMPLRDKDGKIIGTFGISRDITEQKKAEQEIRLLAHTIASTRDCVVIGDLQDRIIFVNNAFIETYGYSREELIGKPVSMVRPEQISTNLGKEIFDKTLDEGWHGEMLNRRKDGSEFAVELWTSVVKNDTQKVIATVGVARDITERKWTEDALAKKTELFRLVSNLTTDYIFVEKIADNGNAELDLVVGALEEITGYTEEEYRAVGDWRTMIHPDDREKDDRDFQQLLNNEKVLSEIRTIHKDGRIMWLRTYAHPIWDEKANRVIGICGAVQDITQQKLAELERESLISELKTALENVRTLGGLLPICASCKKIRDDKGYWNQLEKYIGDHTDAKLTHGLCPDCAKIYFPEAASKAGI